MNSHGSAIKDPYLPQEVEILKRIQESPSIFTLHLRFTNPEAQQQFSFEEMPLEKAREIGATGIFDAKYSEKVKVYTVGEGDDIFSKEICGGPHVDNIGGIGKFRIKKEESSSAGVRRIKAILE